MTREECEDELLAYIMHLKTSSHPVNATVGCLLCYWICGAGVGTNGPLHKFAKKQYPPNSAGRTGEFSCHWDKSTGQRDGMATFMKMKVASTLRANNARVVIDIPIHQPHLAFAAEVANTPDIAARLEQAKHSGALAPSLLHTPCSAKRGSWRACDSHCFVYRCRQLFPNRLGSRVLDVLSHHWRSPSLRYCP